MVSATNIAVLGAGSWGTALSLALARKQHKATLWSHSQKRVAQLAEDRCNQHYLPGFSFPDNLCVEHDLQKLVSSHTVFLVSTPSHAFRQIIKKISACGLTKDSTIIWATKGFDGEGQSAPVLLSDVITQELGKDIRHAVVSGPSFAKEVAEGLPTAIVAAGSDVDTTERVAKLFHGQNMRVYTNADLVGVQIGGAVKNVMAIAAGISDGLGFGANSRSAIITRGLAEIARLGCAMGANKETFLGLAGIGDLVLTCTDNLSRNRRFGLGLGQSQSIQKTLLSIGQEVEGIITTKETARLALQHNIDMPISQQIHRVLFDSLSPKDAVDNLLTRELTQE